MSYYDGNAWFEPVTENIKEKSILDKYKFEKNDMSVYIDAYSKHGIILEYARHNSLTLLNSPDSYDNFLKLSLQILS